MPSRPVSASTNIAPSTRGSARGAGAADAADKFNATAAQSKFSAAHNALVRSSPNSGISQNAQASTPSIAPSVLPA